MEFKAHLDRVKAAVSGTYGLTTLNQYITEKTYLNGKLYSFKDHEFQLAIGESTALEDITVKCAQIGISEYYYRWALAACRNIPDFTVIYTFPNASDSSQNCTTRINPIVDNSPDLAQAVHPDVNNSELKQFGRNSFLYMRGTRSQAGAISIPADVIINDEWDKSDIATATMYVARLQHKPTKMVKKFSTPTFEKYGILKEAETARRMRHLLKCDKCSFTWAPSYFNDIKIPGYDDDLKNITKANLKNINWEKATLLCPHCGRKPRHLAEDMFWVCENPNDNYPALARFITPFSAPGVLMVPTLGPGSLAQYLVQSSTMYKKYSEFVNQGLGLAAESDEDNLSEADVRRCFTGIPLDSGETHIFASDMGLICHAAVGRVSANGQVLVVHTEKIPLGMFEKRRMELIRRYRCVMSVHDTQPYVDMISRITEHDGNAYGTVFATFKAGPIFRVEKKEEDREAGTMNLQQIKIRRNEAFDALMGEIKRGNWLFAGAGDSETANEIVAHVTSMKRVQKFDSNNELTYHWEKTDEIDHFHFALLYLYTGVELRGMAGVSAGLYSHIPLVSVIRNGTAAFTDRTLIGLAAAKRK